MKLVHFSTWPIGTLYRVQQAEIGASPRGLWVSDEAAASSWSAFLGSIKQLPARFAHDLELAQASKLAIITSPDALANFWRRWPRGSRVRDVVAGDALPWAEIAARYSGLIVTPVIDAAAGGPGWYASWKWAGGCIWDPVAVTAVRLRDVPGRQQSGRRALIGANGIAVSSRQLRAVGARGRAAAASGAAAGSRVDGCQSPGASRRPPSGPHGGPGAAA